MGGVGSRSPSLQSIVEKAGSQRPRCPPGDWSKRTHCHALWEFHDFLLKAQSHGTGDGCSGYVPRTWGDDICHRGKLDVCRDILDAVVQTCVWVSVEGDSDVGFAPDGSFHGQSLKLKSLISYQTFDFKKFLWYKKLCFLWSSVSKTSCNNSISDLQQCASWLGNHWYHECILKLNIFLSYQKKLSKCLCLMSVLKFKTITISLEIRLKKFIWHQYVSSQKKLIMPDIQKIYTIPAYRSSSFNRIPATGFQIICVTKLYWISKLFVIHLKLGLKNYNTSMQIHKECKHTNFENWFAYPLRASSSEYIIPRICFQTMWVYDYTELQNIYISLETRYWDVNFTPASH